MKKNCLVSIKQGWQFRKLFTKGLHFSGNVLRARYKTNSLGRLRLGFSVSAKKGNSVERNLFKRRLRQYSVDLSLDSEKGIDAVIIPLTVLKNVGWIDIKKDMDNLVASAKRELK